MSSYSVMTSNIRVTLSLPVAIATLSRALKQEKPDIVAVQEWGTSRDKALGRLCAELGYGRARAKGAGPVLWDKKRYRFISVKPKRLARASFMGRIPGRRSTLPASIATQVTLQERLTGKIIVVFNIHLTAEVQNRFGSYHQDAARRKRVRRHKRERRSLRRICRRQRRKGREVIVAGDTNFDGMEIPGMVSCWRGRPDKGTLGNRAVDIIFTAVPAVKVIVIRNASDHHTVCAQY